MYLVGPSSFLAIYRPVAISAAHRHSFLGFQAPLTLTFPVGWSISAIRIWAPG